MPRPAFDRQYSPRSTDAISALTDDTVTIERGCGEVGGEHVAGDRLREEEGAAQVDVEHAVVRGRSDIEQIAAAAAGMPALLTRQAIGPPHSMICRQHRCVAVDVAEIEREQPVA